MADIWLSGTWASDEKLIEFMLAKFDMQIDEDYFSFYNPKVTTSK
jgi:hypothetical protein